ncbi:bacillithiol system redox-active protein YtxJ [Fictibacillus sp. WQ 8-8]|uniref:Bacillithiol system redox-active protein YtxJ n=1 Tax=Fictibacillus marinisediminis TaxID=2878389 RepID=A0A9X1XCA8_9BACL|nr:MULTISPECIES: bacillithiol system redox-active protein YtxJ [Fictibacillus]MCK6258081.1 bacillithiol system redox-active protein YtxJ [Fictibacillus marinisediminis]MCQ6266604.1 bacillithiol system redox-active protein YtxJ [Fictibacillus sp. WQ 8-8]SFD57871.1 bacillithiol system protein YtxJ [Bacillus sp. OV194]
MPLTKISDSEAFKKAISENGRVFVLKNSTTCPISHAAFEEYKKFAEDQSGNLYYLNVQEARPLSNEIAEAYGIKHESPQVLLFENGEVKWNDSHWSITYSALQDKVNQ